MFTTIPIGTGKGNRTGAYVHPRWVKWKFFIDANQAFWANAPIVLNCNNSVGIRVIIYYPRTRTVFPG